MSLVVRGLERRYGGRVALSGVSLEARPGEVVGLLGPNGAGKSTLMRCASGLLVPDAGTVHVDGLDLWKDAVAARGRLGYAPEEPAFYEELSADEWLAFVATVHGLAPAAARGRAAGLVSRLGLAGRTGEPVRSFSHGMRKKLSFLAAILPRPRVLLCDEALEGFDAAAAIEARRELRELAAAGTAVLFSSHVTETLERLCDRVILFHRGRPVRELARAAWGAPTAGPSPLEAEFLSMIGAGEEHQA